MSGDLWTLGAISLIVAAAGMTRHRRPVDGARNQKKYEIKITREGRYYIENLITEETSIQYGEDWATPDEAKRALRYLKRTLQKAKAA